MMMMRTNTDAKAIASAFGGKSTGRLFAPLATSQSVCVLLLQTYMPINNT